MAFVPAILLLLDATFLNDQRNKIGFKSYLESSCGGTDDGLSTAGGILVLVSNFLRIGYYLALRPIKGILPVGEPEMQGTIEIAMGQAQLPPPVMT